MAQPPPEQSFYHHPHPHAHTHPHSHPHPHSHAHPHPHPHSHPHSHPQLQLPPQFRNPFDLLFDERTSAINYNYIRPYIPNQLHKPDELSDSLVMRRPRRTRTTFTSSQIAELEQHFLQGRYLTSSRLAELSSKLALGTAQVKIWFKNRRRRHKIQTDQQKDHSSSFSCDGMPMSPAMPGIKSEGPVSLQSLSLTCNGGGNGSGNGGGTAGGNGSGSGGGNSSGNGSGSGGGGSTPTTLTPSPTPTTPTASIMEHYGDSFNQYYYNNHHGVQPPPPPLPHAHPHHPHAHLHAHQYPPTTAAVAAAAVAQFFPAQTSAASGGAALQHQHQQHHQHPHNHQHQHQQQHQQQQQQQQQQQHHQAQTQAHQVQYNGAHAQQYEFQHKPHSGNNGGIALKDDPDFNFNNPYYMRMSVVAPPEMAVAMVASNVGNATAPTASANDGTTSSMSPNSEVYEPLTPKHDESPSLCNGGGGGGGVGNSVELADEMDESNTKSLQVLIAPPKNIGRGVEACSNVNSIISGGDSAVNILEDCTGAFAKYSKMASDVHETNYQCTMDTIMHAYNSHRTSTGNTQFAYCFN